MSVDYQTVLKAAEKFTDDNTPWDEKFKHLVSLSAKEQADAFKLRFVLQLEKQGVDVREVITKVDSIADMFTEKAKGGNGKSLKYGGIEFGDVLKEFLSDSKMSFVERKKEFKDFDLDNNGLVDVAEFLLFIYKDQVMAGYLVRHGLKEPDVENDAEIMIRECVNLAVMIDAKLDDQVLSIARLKTEYEADVQVLKDDATNEVKKRQLTNNLKQRESRYEDERKNLYSEEQLGKSKAKLLKTQETHLRALEAAIAKDATDALKPKKNLKMP